MLELVIEARRRSLGDLEVGRILPFMKRRMVGPFIFLDHIGPLRLPPDVPRSADVRPHPHIGLSTVTYLFTGEIMHRDSLGVEQPIRPGEVNWMTAGRGISHSERFDPMRARGGELHGLQAWVALPVAAEECAPAFAHYGIEEMPALEERGLKGRVIAGEAFGLSSSVRTHSPLFYLHVELEAGALATLPSGPRERAAYLVSGRAEVGGRTYAGGQMLVFSAEAEPVITAIEPTVVMMLGGDPVGERHIWWNFVSSRKDRIEEAKADWAAGRIPLPLTDRDEFIPLPEEPMPRPEPMS
ncbi:MAG TPA: pirin family protein [Alphaproteobacteria bacterium]|nr:pirin family protein [Alphaproteobacteria bacterium]